MTEKEKIIRNFLDSLRDKYILFASVATNNEVSIYSSDEQVDLLISFFLEKNLDKKREINRKFQELERKWIITGGHRDYR